MNIIDIVEGWERDSHIEITNEQRIELERRLLENTMSDVDKKIMKKENFIRRIRKQIAEMDRLIG